jgi:WD40 repeat protein
MSQRNNDDSPRIYSVVKDAEGFRLTRRGFMGMAVGATAAGCSKFDSGNEQKDADQKIATNVVQTKNCGEFKAHKESVIGLSLSSDGNILVSLSYDKTLKIWSLAEGKLLKTLDWKSLYRYTLSISPDGKIVALGSYRTIELWSVTEGKILKELEGQDGHIKSLAITTDNKILASGNVHSDPMWDYTIKLWSLPDYKLVKTLEGHTSSISALSISPDGDIFALASKDTIRVWSLPDGNLLRGLKVHKSPVFSMSFGPDGKTLLSISYDKTFKVTTLPDGNLLTTIGWNKIVAVSSGGERMASGGDDGTIRFWSLPKGSALGCLLDPESTAPGTEAITYRAEKKETDSSPRDIVTVPARQLLPVDTACICNTVDVGKMVVPKGHERKMRGTTCSCNTVYTCDSVSRGGDCGYRGGRSSGHYWRPN